VIKIIRVTHPGSLDLIRDRLIVSDGFDSQTHVAEGLKNLLLENPQNCFFTIVVEDDTILMFVLAYLSPREACVEVFQTWASAAYPAKNQDQIFMRLLLWSEQIGVLELRMKSLGNDESFMKSWGFEPRNIQYRLDVDKIVNDMIAKQTSKLKGETDGGSKLSVDSDVD